MRNTLKKVIASAMAVASLTMGTAGINVSASDINALGSTEATINEPPSRTGCVFYLSDTNEHLITCVTGPATVYCTVLSNNGAVTFSIRNSSGAFISSHYISSGYSPTFSINVPAGETYCFYVRSPYASPSNIVSVALYF